MSFANSFISFHTFILLSCKSPQFYFVHHLYGFLIQQSVQVSAYGDKLISTSQSGEQIFQEGSIVSDFQSMADILLALMNNNTDGRVIISKQKSSLDSAEEGHLKFVMLSGEKIFSEVYSIYTAFI